MLEKQYNPASSVFTLPIFWTAGFLICHDKAKYFPAVVAWHCASWLSYHMGRGKDVDLFRDVAYGTWK